MHKSSKNKKGMTPKWDCSFTNYKLILLEAYLQNDTFIFCFQFTNSLDEQTFDNFLKFRLLLFIKFESFLFFIYTTIL